MQTTAKVIVAVLLAAAVAGGIVWWQSRQPMPLSEAGPAAPEPSGGFSFIGLNAASRIDTAIRHRLRDQLGSEAVAHKSLIDLRFGPPGTLESLFPDLSDLHRRLNSPLGERREHDVLRLSYHYPRRENLPFKSVMLLFDGRDGVPLLFDVHFTVDGEALLGTLADHYGPPEDQLPAGDGGWVRWWRQPGAVLMAALLPDRKGKARYLVRYLFTEHLEQLVEREAQAAEREEKAAREAGKRLF